MWMESSCCIFWKLFLTMTSRGSLLW
jgi:hypothetical protein